MSRATHDRLSHLIVHRQILEMRNAINQIPYNDPYRDFAINQANDTENKLLEALRKQDLMDAASPDMLEALQDFVDSHDKEDGFVSNAIYDKAVAAIKKATE